MNTLLKGALAGVAGIALLLGGAGTFALWNSSATVTGGTIVAGQLLVSGSTTPGTWSVNGGADRTTLDGFKAVPGDSLVYTRIMNITATGDNLVATLSMAPASISVLTPSTANNALAAYLTKTAVLTAAGTDISTDGVTVTAGTAGVSQTITAKVTVTFPKSTTPGFENDTMLGSVSLADMAVTLTQK